MELTRFQRFELTVAQVTLSLSRRAEEYAAQAIARLEPQYPPTPVYLSERWNMHYAQFLSLGEPLKFSQRKMYSAGVCDREVWDEYTRNLCSAGVLVTIPSVKTCYTDEFLSGCPKGSKVRHFREIVKWGLIALPYPTYEPPELLVARSTGTRYTRHGTVTRAGLRVLAN